LYLALQAERIFRKKQPVDLEGSSILAAAGKTRGFIPRGSFGALQGQVYLYGYETSPDFPDAGRGNFRQPLWG